MIYTETGNGADNDVRPVLCSHINSSTSKLVPEKQGNYEGEEEEDVCEMCSS